MSSRNANEKKYKNWNELVSGRLYWRMVHGKYGWHAIYYKEVDENETITKLWQEIYNEDGVLKEIHEKYPEDKGHQKL
jgi:hypothetical protein